MTKTNKRITRTQRTKTKHGGSCIQSNCFVSLIKDIVASIIILLAITFIGLYVICAVNRTTLVISILCKTCPHLKHKALFVEKMVF